MEPRQLQFATFGDALAELDRLQTRGYTPAGNWNLGQVCDHLAFFIDGTLDGHKFRVPWIFKAVFGRWVLKRILNKKQMKRGGFTPQKPLPLRDIDEATAVAHLKNSLNRLKTNTGELHPSPFFGTLTPEQWREMHLIHCAHHLGHLIPKS